MLLPIIRVPLNMLDQRGHVELTLMHVNFKLKLGKESGWKALI
jgi:hypothetical protein